MPPNAEHEYLTARELAELLRVRERKVYELAAAGEVPCSRAMGKLLFPRAGVSAWLARASSGPRAPAAASRENVVAGSHDPLLEWALRESGAGLASYFDGSLDGVERFARGGAVATALHVADDGALGGDEAAWNLALVRDRFATEPVALIAFARRERGLIVARGEEGGFRDVEALRGRRVAVRQAGAGSQMLLERMLGASGVEADAFEPLGPARSEHDAALAVAEGRAEVAFGLAGPARQLGLGFVPLLRERFDLLLERRAWLEPPLQRLDAFCRGAAFAERAAALGGYDASVYGKVRFNGP